MKKKILLLLTFLYSIACWATHNRAGEITYQQIGALTYQVTTTTYTKTSSIPADRDSLQVCWGDGNCEFVTRSNGNGTLLLNDVKENHYVGTYTYAALGNYTVSMTDPNRNGGILNCNTPFSDQVPFYLETQINIQSVGMNNSPIFLHKPIDVGYVNQAFAYCTNHIDTEGDSLTYELVVPKQGVGSPVPNYSFPNSIGAQPQSLSIDSKTGMITWLSPQVAGEYIIAILLKEYRNGVLIGSILRDMQITILSANNRPPNFNDTTNVFYEVLPGQTIQFSLNASDADGDNIQLSATGFPLQRNANFTAPSNNMSDSISGSFSWTPTSTDLRNQPYQMAFRVEDDAEGTFGGVLYKIVQIKVTSVLTTKKFKDDIAIRLFPNPATNYVRLEFETPLFTNGTLRIFTSSGSLVRMVDTQKGQQFVKIDVSDVPIGTYIVTMTQEGKIATRQLVIIR